VRKKKGGSGKEEGAQLDLAIDKLAGAYKELVVLAQGIARKIAKADKQVSSPDVWKHLWEMAEHDDGLKTKLTEADPRWMGVVFRHRQWYRVGWKANGSHKRPVSIWELQPELKV
jgi:hypothetical protein